MIYLTIMPKSATKEPMIEKLKQLQATIGKYAVWGNHDYGGGASAVYDEVMEASGFTVMKTKEKQ